MKTLLFLLFPFYCTAQNMIETTQGLRAVPMFGHGAPIVNKKPWEYQKVTMDYYYIDLDNGLQYVWDTTVNQFLYLRAQPVIIPTFTLGEIKIIDADSTAHWYNSGTTTEIILNLYIPRAK